MIYFSNRNKNQAYGDRTFPVSPVCRRNIASYGYTNYCHSAEVAREPEAGSGSSFVSPGTKLIACRCVKFVS